MTAPAAGRAAPPAWHDDAERLGPALDRAAAVLVVGRDGDAAAWAALGAARAQAARRRVAVADLVGDAPALAALADPDEPVGVSDSFFYGVSLSRIACPADASGDLFVLPSGTEPVAVEEVLASERWRRLAAGFREAGALLILAARADAPGLDRLAASVDGLVVVGDLGGLLPDAPPPLMVIPGPSVRRGRAAAARPAEPAQAEAADERPADAAAWAAQQTQAAPQDAGRPTLGPPTPVLPTPAAPEFAGPRRATPAVATPAGAAPPAPAGRGVRELLALALGVVALAGVGAIAYLGRDAGDDPAPAARAARAVQAPTPAPSAAPTAPPPAAAAATAAGPLTPANPADSARAAAFAVFLASANTPEGATLEGVDQATLPILSLTPVQEGGDPWWRLLAGAYPTRAGADSLLAELRSRGVLGSSSGQVVRAPYALLVADRLPAAQAPARVAELAQRGVPTYPLSRGDGTVALYAGAFVQPADAEFLAGALRAAGVNPVLVYRTGGTL